MRVLRKRIKSLFQITHTLFILDNINFVLAYLKGYRKNRKFRKANPDFRLPPDYFLYETYRLDYNQYKEDGNLSAKEVFEWTSRYLPKDLTVLEWGCGVSRAIRHFPEYASAGSTFFACDINARMIEWNKRNIEKVTFETIHYIPPTNYPNDSFDLVYAFSVFTHIEKNLQQNWINEISRIIKPGGIFLFTTHGRAYFDKLDRAGLTQLSAEGAYTISYHQKGHRMMSTYNTYDAFKQLVGQRFTVLEYYDGAANREKVGGQDLWIVRKL